MRADKQLIANVLDNRNDALNKVCISHACLASNALQDEISYARNVTFMDDDLDEAELGGRVSRVGIIGLDSPTRYMGVSQNRGTLKIVVSLCFPLEQLNKGTAKSDTPLSSQLKLNPVAKDGVLNKSNYFNESSSGPASPSILYMIWAKGKSSHFDCSLV